MSDYPFLGGPGTSILARSFKFTNCEELVSKIRIRLRLKNSISDNDLFVIAEGYCGATPFCSGPASR